MGLFAVPAVKQERQHDRDETTAHLLDMRVNIGYKKVGHKARRGRKRKPFGHGEHRKRAAYSPYARQLKRRMALAFAPRIADWEIV